MIGDRPPSLEGQAICNRVIIRVSFRDIRVTGSQMAGHETYGRVVQIQTDTAAPFVPRHAT